MKGKFVKPPDFKYPDVSSLVKIAQIETGNLKCHAALGEDDHGL